ncbi:hypothetical protein [Streptomyces bohaiensis]|uniref:hypothetical protein n=1 Tax=Streptomyces bohaiensis TaxID=1431344 RepID=UPI003B7BDBB1
MVVAKVVAAAIRRQSRAEASVFVASCAERAAQIFTGLSGLDPARGMDVDVAVRLVEDLWAVEASSIDFQRYLAAVEEFREFEPSGEERVEVGGIYSFYSALVMRYAALYRCSMDIEHALKCAHVSLTAMGQLDQNLPKAVFFAQESQVQRQVSSLADVSVILEVRRNDQVLSRERLAAILGRMNS